MSSAKYELIPQTPDSNRNGPESDEEEDEVPHLQSTPDYTELVPLESESVTTPEEVPHDPRFDQPVPSPFKRAALIIFMFFLFWLAFTMRKAQNKPNVIYASRYSKEFKYRPAASPIITETLKDGRIRIRGAGPTTQPVIAPTATPKATKKGKRRSKKGKKSSSTKKRMPLKKA